MVLGNQKQFKCFSKLWWLVGCHVTWTLHLNSCPKSCQGFSIETITSTCVKIYNNFNWNRAVLSLTSTWADNYRYSNHSEYILEELDVQYSPVFLDYNKDDIESHLLWDKFFLEIIKWRFVKKVVKAIDE